MTDSDDRTQAAQAAPSELENIVKRVSILMEQKDWQNAAVYCQKALDIAPEDPELYLTLCMIGHQVSSEEELKSVPCNLGADRNFQTALKHSAPERAKQLSAIQDQSLKLFINNLLQQCMAKYQISDLALCPAPLLEEQPFQMALSMAPMEIRNDLLKIQANQPQAFLQRCLSRHPGCDLSTYPEPLMKNPDFQMAVRCAAPELRNQLLQAQAAQPDFFLKKCMESYGVSTVNELERKKAPPLVENEFFKYAMECGSPEFQKQLREIMTRQTRNGFFAHPVVAVILIVLILAFTAGFIIPWAIRVFR